MKTDRRTFIKLLGAGMASLWGVGRKTIDVEALEPDGLEAKTSVEPRPEVAWDSDMYFLAEPLWPKNCAVCMNYFCSPNCSNYKECGYDGACSSDCPIALDVRETYKHCPFKAFKGLETSINTGHIDKGGVQCDAAEDCARCDWDASDRIVLELSPDEWPTSCAVCHFHFCFESCPHKHSFEPSVPIAYLSKEETEEALDCCLECYFCESHCENHKHCLGDCKTCEVFISDCPKNRGVETVLTW